MYYAAGMSEREQRMGRIAACRLDSLSVTRHTRVSSVYFNRGLGSTKLNPGPSIFTLTQHLQRKPPKSRADPEERSRKQQKKTPQRLKTQESVYLQKKKNKSLNQT